MGNLIEWLALSLTPGLGPVGCLRLVEHFGRPEMIFKAAYGELIKVHGIKKSCLEFLANTPPLRAAEGIARNAEKTGTTIISWENPGYPEQLRNIANPPVVLFTKGNKEALKMPGIAIVGARSSTSYGQNIAARFATQIADKGLSVISGLALGIDTAAHAGALSTGGTTIAVLGCGIEIIYPKQNRKLYEKIMATGAIVSEYPFGTPPDAFRFPARNRIISGLSHGVLVVEATKNSGSLITAQHALEQGKDIFAVPGRIDSIKSEGTHRLLQQGAKLVHTLNDILEELIFFPAPTLTEHGNKATDTTINHQDLSADEEKIFSLLTVYPKTIDEIIREADLSSQKTSEALLLLELKSLIKVLPGKQYQKEV